MKRENESTPFENILLALLTRNGQNSFVSGSAEHEAEIVFSKRYPATLSKEKAEALVKTVAERLSKETLGSLVRKEIESSQYGTVDLLAQTGLTESMLEAIRADMVYTNSVPVKSLVRLLKKLNIASDKAKAAIEATFDKLITESKLFSFIPTSAQPSFRKGTSYHEFNSDIKRMRSDESYLYQNKEALDKYTHRLGELYNEI